ncbi:MAG: restriction endonuclease subunit S [Bacteroidia bacterium]|nr:restriction endonuclease subunit S [Bacteroidia bacterium]
MERYEKYKDSGIEWVGEIPESWDVKKIKHRCYVKGRVGWKGLKSSEFLTDGFSYLVTGTDFKNDTVDWDNCYHIDEERYNEDPYIQLQNEDLLITKDGTIGKLAVVTNLDKPACLNSGIFVVRSTKDDFSTRFLLWVLKSSTFTDFNGLTAYGSTIQHLYQNVFVEFAFAFPPVKTQISIANYLQKKTTEIDHIITNKQKLIALYEEEKQAIINQAVTKGLDPNVRLKDSGVEWLGEIPEHWEVKRFNFIFSFSRGLPITKENLKDEGIPCISYGEIHSKFCFEVNPENDYLKCVDNDYLITSEKSLLKRGDFVFADTSEDIPGSGNFTYLNSDTPVFAGYHTIIAVPEVEFTTRFVAYFFDSTQYRNQIRSSVTGTKVYSITQSILKNTNVILPPIQEQKLIVEYIDKEFSRLDSIISKFNKQIDLLQEYRTTLISEVVTGKIKVIA